MQLLNTSYFLEAFFMVQNQLELLTLAFYMTLQRATPMQENSDFVNGKFATIVVYRGSTPHSIASCRH